MRIFWAILALLGALVGVFSVTNAASDIQLILAAGAFTFAAVCGTNATLCHLAIEYDARKLTALTSSDATTMQHTPQSSAHESERILGELNAIRAELQWQRQQKEKEILRAKAALSKKPGSISE